MRARNERRGSQDAVIARGEETRHDVTDRGRRGLRSASRRSSSDQPAALSQRLLARPGDDPRHGRSGVAILSGEFADHLAAGLAAVEGQTRLQPRGHEGAGARSVRRQLRHLQSAVRRADGVQRGHGGRVLPRAERLAGEGMARQGRAAARLDRDPGAEHREVGRGDRALRQGQAFRSGADAGDGRHAARQARLLADLRRRRAARLADRRPCRQQLSQPADFGGLGLLSHRGLCRAGAGVPDPIDQPDRRGRVRPASEPENGDAGIAASPGCRPICGGCISSGAASAWKRPGWTARRWKLCAATSGFRCSRSMRRRIRRH